MRFWKRKTAQAPTPALRVTFRYMTGGVGGVVASTYDNRTATELVAAIANDRREDRIISLGRADEDGNDVCSFPARSIVDIKIALAEEGE